MDKDTQQDLHCDDIIDKFLAWHFRNQNQQVVSRLEVSVVEQWIRTFKQVHMSREIITIKFQVFYF